MTLDENGLVVLWERIRGFVAWYFVNHFPVANMSRIGGVKPDGETISVDDNGTISVTDPVTDHDRALWSTRADWDEDDEDSLAYIENRPFYRMPVIGATVIAQRRFGGNTANFVVLTDSGNNGYALVSENVALQTNITEASVAAGTTYMITVDGESAIAEVYASSSQYDVFGQSSKVVSGVELFAPGLCLIIVTYDTRASVFLPGTRGQTVPYKTVSVHIVSETVVKVPTDYLPIADEHNLGVVKPDGETIVVDVDGTIHGTSQTSIATVDTPGKVKPDGETITIDVDGTIHGNSDYELPAAGELNLGGVKISSWSYITMDSDDYIDVYAGHYKSSDIDKWTKDEYSGNIIYPGGAEPLMSFSPDNLKRLWQNVKEYVQNNAGASTSLESGLSIRNYPESNDMYRILCDIAKHETIIPWNTVYGSGTFTTDDPMATSDEYVLICDGKCYLDSITQENGSKSLEFDLPDGETLTVDIADNSSSRTLSVSCSDGENHEINLIRFLPLDTADLNNNVGGVGFLLRDEYASTTSAGVIKVGNGLTVDSNGVLSVSMTNLNEVSF